MIIRGGSPAAHQLGRALSGDPPPWANHVRAQLEGCLPCNEDNEGLRGHVERAE